LPPSIFRIDPLKHLPLAKEFRENPVGHHSANLQCILNLFRGEPLEGKYILVCTKPHEEWQLGILSGVRGKPVELLRRSQPVAKPLVGLVLHYSVLSEDSLQLIMW